MCGRWNRPCRLVAVWLRAIPYIRDAIWESSGDSFIKLAYDLSRAYVDSFIKRAYLCTHAPSDFPSPVQVFSSTSAASPLSVQVLAPSREPATRPGTAARHAASRLPRGSPPAGRELPTDLRFSAVRAHVLGASTRNGTSRRPHEVQCGGVLG